ncbi:MAG: flagellar export protein FliJ [Bacteroides sp.]|nr:flagellar export protein FliJ [Bacteroides sp.]MCM1550011.1 flagellar export protein FliJ [Clostridium sp.]
MAKFLYRMQNILNIKYKLEEQAKQEFSNAQYRYRQEEERLEHFKKRKRDYTEEMRGHAKERLNVMELERCNNAIALMDIRIREQKEVVFRAMTEMDRARAKLNQSMQERKTHEKLKEHQFESFLQELNAEEMKEIDELVSYQHNTSEEGA